MTTAVWERGVADIERLGAAGLGVDAYRTKTLQRLRSLLDVDAAFYATTDPMTMLFTSAVAEEPLAAATTLFLENEFGCDDVNKFASLAGAADPVGSLDRATRGDRAASARYREVMAPMGLGDEVRVALRTRDRCWGVICLHREDGPLGFDETETVLLRRLSRTLGEGLRRSVALAWTADDPPAVGGPGIIVLAHDLSVASINPQAERWLSEVAPHERDARSGLPVAVLGAAAQVVSGRTGVADVPTRIRRAAGGWISMHASPLQGPGGPFVAVVLDHPDNAEMSSLVLAVHDLTPAQSRVVALVLQGRSTRAIVAELQISSHTVQEHLRAVFDKLGIGSRRELVAALMQRPR